MSKDSPTVAPHSRALLVRSSSWICALPLSSVLETMRALPIQEVKGAPPFVRGVAVIRGLLLPVIELSALFDAGSGAGRWFVTLQAGARQLAIAVDEVIGIQPIDDSASAAPHPLLDKAIAEHVEKLGTLDAHAFAILSAARLLPDAARLDP